MCRPSLDLAKYCTVQYVYCCHQFNLADCTTTFCYFTLFNNIEGTRKRLSGVLSEIMWISPGSRTLDHKGLWIYHGIIFNNSVYISTL